MGMHEVPGRRARSSTFSHAPARQSIDARRAEPRCEARRGFARGRAANASAFALLAPVPYGPAQHFDRDRTDAQQVREAEERDAEQREHHP